MSQQSEQVISTVSDRLVHKAEQSGLQLRSPDGFKQTQRSKALTGWNKAERVYGAGIRTFRPDQHEYDLLLDCVTCFATGEAISNALSDQMKEACKTS